MLADWGNDHVPPHLGPYVHFATLLVIFACLKVLLSGFAHHLNRAYNMLSSPIGRQRRRHFVLFLCLSLFCFFWISVARFSQNAENIPDLRVAAFQAAEDIKIGASHGLEDGKAAARQAIHDRSGTYNDVKHVVEEDYEKVKASAQALNGAAGEKLEAAKQGDVEGLVGNPYAEKKHRPRPEPILDRCVPSICSRTQLF
jgi:hypothetical protein